MRIPYKPENIKNHRDIPIASVSFHTATDYYQALGVSSESDNPMNTLVSASTQKTMSSPAGSFSLVLLGEDWLKRLKSNDLTVIEMGYREKNNVDNLHTRMVGLIDSVTKTRHVVNNKPTLTTTVKGRDFGKILLKSMLKFYPILGWDKKKEKDFFLSEPGWLKLREAFLNDNAMKGSPAKILDTIIRFILQKIMSVEWKIYDAVAGSKTAKTISLPHVLRYSFGKMDMFLPMLLTAHQYEGSLWNLMERASIKPFMELFIDVRPTSEQVITEAIEEASTAKKADVSKDKGGYAYPGISFGKDRAQVTLFLRGTPFDRTNWNKLKKHVVPPDEIISEDLTVSDNEHYNLFWAGTTITPFANMENLKLVAPPLINEDNIKRYGLSPLEVSIEGLSLNPENENTESIALEGLSKTFSAKLRAWFENNHLYSNGSVRVRGRGDYKIGQVFVHSDLGKEFYIEGVADSFEVGSHWTSTLTITRGMSTKDLPDHTKYFDKKTIEDKMKKPEYHTVKRGETLWYLAGKYYKNNLRWTKIWEANKEMLIKRDSRNKRQPGHWIYPGQKLIIPPL